MSAKVRVTTVDLETGEEESREVEAGDYCIVTAWPLVVGGVQLFGNGTVQLTLKRADREQR